MSESITHAVKLLISNDKHEVLVLTRNPEPRPNRKPRRGPDIPGGEVEVGEDSKAAAGRELFEETGLRAEGLFSIGKYETQRGGSRVEVECYIGQVVGNEAIRLSSEHIDGQWRPEADPGLEFLQYAATRKPLNDELRRRGAPVLETVEVA